MKRFIILFGAAWLFAANANADICHEVNNEIASKAIELIKKHKKIYSYCSICKEAQPQIIHVQNIKKDNAVYINDKAMDLAHIYYKEGNKYINLGIASGCIEDGKYGIFAKLDNLTKIHSSQKNNQKHAKQQAQYIFDKCSNNIKNKKIKTTQDMVKHNIKINKCIANAIKQEIKKGFKPEQQTKMLEYLEQTQEGIWNFYNGIYSANKYCYGQCGSITNLLPYSDEGRILIQMLESLLYLNIEKNGY